MEKDSAIENSHPTATESWNWQPTSKKIQKIPTQLRQEECNKDAYDPKVVSFGPYHHGKPELKFCEDAKHLALQLFVEGSGYTKENLLSKVMEKIADIRSCYIEGSTDKHTDEKFAEMMLLDACFLIFLMEISTQNEQQRVDIFNHLGILVTTLMFRDTVLLENQIPFQVLTFLISLISIESEKSVIEYLYITNWGEFTEQQFDQDIPPQLLQLQQQPPLHLFEAYRRVLVWDPSDPTPESQENIIQVDIDWKKPAKTIRSAKDLKAKGIQFKPSSSNSLLKIEFNHGHLELPAWYVTCHSKVYFLNMIAYELCPNNFVDPTVTSYINFMESLIESPGDVKELREKRILLTSVGSDKEVMKLYRGMNTYGISSFAGVKQKIQHHYDSKARTWMAELIHTYLSSPWSFIGWFAGAFLLVLTFTQTYFTIYGSDRKP